MAMGNVRVVLVGTTHQGNIGAAARAMKTMGLSDLCLVSPGAYPSEEARLRAAGGAELVDAARVTDTLAEAVADCVLVMATSARSRRIAWPELTPREAGERMVAESARAPVAVVFGREAHGLSNEDLNLGHYHIVIPANPDYGVLNLAAAVQVMTYELRMAYLGQYPEALPAGTPTPEEEEGAAPAQVAEMESFYEHLEAALVALGFLDPDNPRQLLTRLRRLFNRARPAKAELQMLRGILSAAQKAAKR